MQKIGKLQWNHTWPPLWAWLFLLLGTAGILLLWPHSLLAQAALDTSDEIVFIDGDGYIRVWDTTQTAGNNAVEWISPIGNWRDFALGDVNDDGDLEVIAIGGDGGEGKLIVYDPVVLAHATGSEERINDIPWAKLYEVNVVGRPTLVVAGDFDVGRPGHEIAYGSALSPEDTENPDYRFEITILRSVGEVDGRDWEAQLRERRFRHTWTWLAAGNIDGQGPDEIVLVDNDDGILSLYRVEHGMDDDRDRIFNHETDSWPWQAAVIGQVVPGGNPELVAVRQAPVNLPSLLIIQYFDGLFVDEYGEAFDPGPRYVFLGDMNDSGDKEVVMLRSVPSSVSGRPRLILRNRGSDPTIILEDVLDADSGYRAGAAGDIDGDDKDEIVIIRENRLRTYPSPDTSVGSSEEPFTTNRRSIAIGDLDKNGYQPLPRFGSSPSSLQAAVPMGAVSQAYEIVIRNVGTLEPLPFSASLHRNPSWATISQDATHTPAAVTLRFDANMLNPGTYRTEVVVTSSYPDVANQPYAIPAVLSVEPALVTIPTTVLFDYHPCEDPLEPRTRQLAIGGLIGDDFQVRLVADGGGSPDWLSATPLQGTIPTTLDLTADPARRDGAQWLRAAVVITAHSSGTSATRVVPVHLSCAPQALYLPLVQR